MPPKGEQDGGYRIAFAVAVDTAVHPLFVGPSDFTVAVDTAMRTLFGGLSDFTVAVDTVLRGALAGWLRWIQLHCFIFPKVWDFTVAVDTPPAGDHLSSQHFTVAVDTNIHRPIHHCRVDSQASILSSL